MVDKKKMYILSFINALSSSILIVLAIFTKNVIDGATSNDKNKLIISAILLVSAILLQVALKIIANVVRNHYDIEITLGLKGKIYHSLLNKKIIALNFQHSGEYTNNFLSDINNVANGLTYSMPLLWGEVARFICALISLAILDWRFLLALVVFGIFLFIAARIYTKIIKKWHRASLEIGGKVNAFVQESIENAKIIKAMEAEKRSWDAMDQLLENNKKVRRTLLRIALIGSVGVSSALNIIYAFGIVYGASLIFVGALGYGSLTAILQLVGHFEGPIANFSTIINGLATYKVSYGRLQKILDLEDEKKEHISLDDFDEIVFDHIDFAYDKSKKILDDFSLTIKKGEIILIKGESGIGKTTLFNLLLGFLEPQKGEIYIKKGEEKYTISSSTRKLFSYVPQENILFSGTIRENIKILADEINEEKIIEALKKARIYEDLMKLEKGIDTKLKERGQGLSLGQIQRILIAISLLNGKKVMLLDEFTSALDNQNEKEIVADLLKLDKTLLIVSHRDLGLDNIKTIELGVSK